jgi:hypothetical protein
MQPVGLGHAIALKTIPFNSNNRIGFSGMLPSQCQFGSGKVPSAGFFQQLRDIWWQIKLTGLLISRVYLVVN